MSIEITYGIWIAAFCIAMLGIGVYAFKKVKNSEDFMVAGRGLPFWLATPVLFATWLGGGLVLGASGASYQNGIWSDANAWGVIPDPFGAGLCLVLAGLFYMPILRKMGGLTLADFFLVRYNKATAMVVSIAIAITFVFWTAVQVISFGKIFESMIGIDYLVGIIISLVVMVAFTVLGGLWAVSLTDFWQTFIIVAGIILLVPFALNAAGGWDSVVASVPQNTFNFFPQNASFLTYLPWIGAWMIIGLGSICTPDLAQRAMASKDEKTAKYSAVTAGILYWVVGMVPVILGIIGLSLVNQGIMDGTALNDDAELVIPMMVKQYMPTTMGVIFTLGMVAGIMSAADAALLSVASIVAKNIYKDTIKPDASDKSVLKVTRWMVLAVTAVALIIGVVYPEVYLLTNFSFDLVLACLFVPLTLGLWWKKANSTGAIAAIIAGAVYRIIAPGIVEGFSFESITYPVTWYYYTVFAPIISLVVMVLVSLATQKRDVATPLKLN
jgi:SSS family transporter